MTQRTSLCGARPAFPPPIPLKPVQTRSSRRGSVQHDITTTPSSHHRRRTPGNTTLARATSCSTVL